MTTVQSDCVHKVVAGSARPPAFGLAYLYLKNVGQEPLLTAGEQVELARDLSNARSALARLARTLPRHCRRQVLEGPAPSSRRGSDWSLNELERFYERLLQYGRDRRDFRTRRTLRDARAHKRRLDHARHKLIVANLRLVVHVARKYVNNGLPFLDLIQEGNLGLMRAAEKFRHERGNKFSTYAYWRIRQAMDRAIGTDARTIRVPIQMREKMRRLQRVTAALAREHGRKPTREELVQASGIANERIEEILRCTHDALRFEEVARDFDLLEIVADPDAPSPAKQTEERDLRQCVDRALARLEPREEQVVRQRFGLGRPTRRTLEEIGQQLGLSRERVRQIEACAVDKIRSGQVARDLWQHYRAHDMGAAS
jgi:RNA polymerase primary sigma factor